MCLCAVYVLGEGGGCTRICEFHPLLSDYSGLHQFEHSGAFLEPGGRHRLKKLQMYYSLTDPVHIYYT